MSNLKYRLLTIAALVVVSVWALFPRDVTVRERQPDGSMADVVHRRVPLKRGLDLAGGIHLALEVDETKGVVANKSEALDRALTVVRQRVNEFGVSEPVVQKEGTDRIIVELPGLDDPARAQEVIQKSAYLEFQITDKTQAFERVLPRLDALVKGQGVAAAGPGPAAAPQAPDVAPGGNGLQGLLTATDTGGKGAASDTAAKTAGAVTDSATLPGATGGPVSKLVQPGGMPGQFFVARADEATLQRYLALPAVKAAMPPGKVLRFGSDTTIIGGKSFRPFYMLDARAILTGERLKDAQPNQTPLEGTVVEFTLDNEGGRRFKNETGKHVKDYMAIVLDQRVIGMPPVINSAIGTRGQITMGGKDLQAAQDLALVLRAGALPVPVKIAEARTIGASLGADAIKRGIRAALLGLALVVIIMVGYYRFSGALAVAGLAFYALTTLAFLAAFGADLTLPGIAGFILSIGMAVDANFLQFERIREELEKGRTVRAAIDEGFKNSFSAIVDTHMTTALTAAVLYQYGTGPVQGFAVTLIAGVASSMVSSVFVVRTLFLAWLSKTPRDTQTLSI